jgi:hypothetical protein
VLQEFKLLQGCGFFLFFPLNLVPSLFSVFSLFFLPHLFSFSFPFPSFLFSFSCRWSSFRVFLASLHVLLSHLIVSSCLVASSRLATSFRCFILLLCLILLLHLATSLCGVPDCFPPCPIVLYAIFICFTLLLHFMPHLAISLCTLSLPLTLLLPTICPIGLLPLLPYCFFLLALSPCTFKASIITPSCFFVSHFALLLALCQLVP